MLDSPNFSRKLAAFGLVAGPLLYVLATFVDPAWSDDSATYLGEVASGRARYLAAGMLWSLGALLFIPGTLGLMKLFRRLDPLGQVGALLFTIGLILFASNFTFYAIDVLLSEHGNRSAATGIYDEISNSGIIGALWFGAFLGGVVLGSILIAIAAFRRKVVPIWSPIVLVVSVVLGFLGETQQMSALSLLMLLIGLYPFSTKIQSISDADWARWAPLAGPDHAPETPPLPAA